MRLLFAVRGRRISGRRPERESRNAGRGCSAGERNQAGARTGDTRPTIRNHPAHSGFTLLELIIVLTILSVLTAAAIPMVRNTVIRERESELRLALRQLRQAIDRYKKLHDDTNGAAIPIEFKTQSGYPKDLKVLEEGFIPANVVGTSSNKIRFIRRIPIDPMIGRAEWGLRGYKDDADATSWGGDDVWDVRSKSDAEALNGTKYRDW
jgi:general secretion pathway protein G